MPVTKTAKKALRQNKTRYAKNQAQNAEMKKEIKSFRKLVDAKKMDEAAKQLPVVFQKLDKAAKTGLIKKNTANRMKSRLSVKIASNTSSK